MGIPAAVIAPNNAALARHLAAAAARSGGNSSMPGGGGGWQALVQQAKQRPAAHLPMLLRHSERGCPSPVSSAQNAGAAQRMRCTG